MADFLVICKLGCFEIMIVFAVELTLRGVLHLMIMFIF